MVTQLSLKWNTIQEYLSRVYYTFQQYNLQPNFNFIAINQ